LNTDGPRAGRSAPSSSNATQLTTLRGRSRSRSLGGGRCRKSSNLAVQEVNHAVGGSLPRARINLQRGFTQGRGPGRRGWAEPWKFAHLRQEEIHILKEDSPQGQIKKREGFLLNALREKYTNPEFVSLQSIPKLSRNTAKNRWNNSSRT